MKAGKYSEEQIIAGLKESEAGAKVSDLCRKYGMNDATYYNWKAKYAGITGSDLKRLQSLEVENRRLNLRKEFNDVRPRSSLIESTPREYALMTAGL